MTLRKKQTKLWYWPDPTGQKLLGVTLGSEPIFFYSFDKIHDFF